MMSPSDRCTAALIASAVGDALGAPTEFMTRSQIDALDGSYGVRTFLESPPGITDDTQMLLFTAEALLQDLPDKVDAAYQGYKHWLRTQEPHIEIDVDAYPSALFADPRMHRRRAPGYTCITSLRDHAGPGTRANPRNDSKGCGTVMRIAPVGMIYRQHDDQFVFDLGADISAITRGYDAGTTQPLTTTMLDGLGGGWTAEEALSMAIAAAASCNGSTMDALAICAAISGDSDSVASMAGTLCGAMDGVGEEVMHLYDHVEVGNLINDISSVL